MSRVYGYSPPLPCHGQGRGQGQDQDPNRDQDPSPSKKPGTTFIINLDGAERPVLFEIVVAKYHSQLAHRKHDYGDVVIQVEHINRSGNFMNYGTVKPPVWLLDCFLDYATHRNQRSHMSWSDLADYFGWNVIDATNFNYFTCPRDEYNKLRLDFFRPFLVLFVYPLD